MPATPTDRDKELASAALEKQRAGGKANKKEQRALDKLRAHAEEAKRWEFLKSTPKGHVCELLGRQQKIVDEWASRYGLPVLGRVVDLTAVFAWLGNFIADNSRRLNADDETGYDSPALERFREERAIRERIKRLCDEGQFLPRAEIHDKLTRIATILRSAGGLLEKHHGPEARAILDEAIADATREIDRLAAAGSDHAEPHPG